MSDTRPSILIGIPTSATGRYRAFDMCVSKFIAYCATHPNLPFRIVGGEWGLEPFWSKTGVVPAARNRIVREAIRQQADYVWMLDDDQPFHHQDLEKLFAHGLDAVLPLSPRRVAPFLPLVNDRFIDDWHSQQHWLVPREAGTLQIASGGLAGLLIKTSCFITLGTDGWFEFVHPPGSFDDYAEDYPFYKKLAAAGIDLYCDFDVRFGHQISCDAYLIKQQGQWMTALADSEPFVLIPQPGHPLGVTSSLPSGPRKVVLQ